MIERLTNMFSILALSADTSHLILTLIAFAGIFGIIELLHVSLHLPVEWTRKFAHMSCGIMVACFHWIFTLNWPIVLIGIILSVMMLLARYFKKCESILGVNRRTFGELYFVFAAISLYIISYNYAAYYFIAILTLSVSDSLAALIGSVSKRFQYVVEYHYKTLEGSLIFFISTFFIIHTSLLTLTNFPEFLSFLISLQIAFIVTCLEAVCPNGTDNIAIPLAVYLLLHQLPTLPPSAIITFLFAETAIFLFSLLISAKFHLFSYSGSVVLHFLLFGAFAFDNVTWMIPPLLALGCSLFIFTYLYPPTTTLFKASRVVIFFYISLVPALLVLISYFNRKYHFFPNLYLYPAYVGAICGQFVITVTRLLQLFFPKKIYSNLHAFSIGYACVAFMIPIALWIQKEAHTWHSLWIVLIPSLVIPALYKIIHRFYRSVPFPTEFRMQMLCAILGVLATLPLYM